MRFARALALALLAGISMAWSPRYWSAAVGIAGVCLLGAVWALGVRRVQLHPRQVLLLPISGWSALQFVNHSSVAPWLTMRASLSWLACGMTFFLASQVAGHGEKRRVFLNWLLWGGNLLTATALLHLFGPNIVGTFLYKNHFAAVIDMLAPIALYQSLANPLAGGAAFALLFAGMVASASRTGVLILVAELLIAIGVSGADPPVCAGPPGPALRSGTSRRGRRLQTGGSAPQADFALAAVAVLALAGAAAIAGPERIWEHFHEKNPWSVRGKLLTSTVQMIRQRPWLGYGMGTWRMVYPAFATFDPGLVANEAHNDWAEWASEAGVPFALLMALLVLSLAKPAVQSIWGLGVPMAMVHSLVDYPIREPATALLWFALAGALSCYRHEIIYLNRH